MNRIFLFLVVLGGFLIIPSNARTQENQKISLEWIYNKREGTRIASVPEFVWLTDGTLMIYDTRKPATERTFEKLNPIDGKRTVVLDMKKALDDLRTQMDPDSVPLMLRWPLEFDNAGKRALYIFGGDIFVLDLSSGSFTRLTQTNEEEKCVRFSPDGNKVSYVRTNDLYVFDLSSKTEQRLTTDGTETRLNGSLSWLYWEEIFDRADIAYWWSDDSKKIAYLQTDESEVSLMRWIDFKPAVPAEILQRYPKAGGTNPSVKIGVVQLGATRTNWLDFSEQPFEYIARVQWLPDNQRIAVQTLNRAQTELCLYFADAATGKPVLILKETDSAWVNIQDDLHFMKDGKHFIWASERSGYNHLYRYTMEGKLVNAVTKGEWALRSSGVKQVMAGINEKDGWVYFTALEKSSVEKHLYRVKIDGKNMQRLSKEDGTHRINMSPDAQYYVDQFSNIRTLPALTLYKSDGKSINALASPRPELLAKMDMQFPELFTIPTRDEFNMPAWIMKPKDFDPAKKYPLIIFVYGGPSAPVVSNSWNRDIWFNQMLLDRGFLVASVDNRSATAISKKLENTVLKRQASDGELNDLVDAAQWFKKQTYIDPERLGVWGWSGGGTFTLLALSRSKEFKAGIAVAAVTDWHYYDTQYAERTMKTPGENPDGYIKTNLNDYAKNLHGRLLLVHGTYDDNVHPQNAWNFADELIKANIPFDMMIYPMRKHGITDSPARIHLYNKMLEFWVKNL